MFHHFPDEPGVGDDCLVRSTDFTYPTTKTRPIARYPIFIIHASVTQTGYQRATASGYLKRIAAAARVRLQRGRSCRTTVQDVDPTASKTCRPASTARYQWVDLDGEGAPGHPHRAGRRLVLQAQPQPDPPYLTTGGSMVDARFAPVELVATQPAAGPRVRAGTVPRPRRRRPARPRRTSTGPSPASTSARTTRAGSPSGPSRRCPNLDWHDPNLRFVDLTGDGHADMLITEDDVFTWYPSLAEEGFGPAERRAPSRSTRRTARAWSSPTARSPSISPTCPATA